MAQIGQEQISYECAFLVRVPSTLTDVTGDATGYTVLFGTEIVDLGGDFASPDFTAPATGTYQFNVTLLLRNLAIGHVRSTLSVITSNRNHVFTYADLFPIESDADLTAIGGSTLADMDVDDTAQVVLNVRNAGKDVDVYGEAGTALYSFFSGFRVS